MELSDSKRIYKQVVELIERDILSGILQVDDQTPSTNEFAKIYRINPATALKGLNILVDEGILYKRRGMGMFVAEGAREKIVQNRREEFYQTLLPELITEAKRLELSIDQLIEKIKGEWK